MRQTFFFIATLLLTFPLAAPLLASKDAPSPFSFDGRSVKADTVALTDLWTRCTKFEQGFADATSGLTGLKLKTKVGRSNGVNAGTPWNADLEPDLTVDLNDLEAFARQQNEATKRGKPWPDWATTACMILAHEAVEAAEFAAGWKLPLTIPERITLWKETHEKGIEAENAIREAQGVQALRDKYCSEPVVVIGGESFYILIGSHTEAQYWKDSDLGGALPINHNHDLDLCKKLNLRTKR